MSTDQDVTLRLKLENQAAAGFAAVKKDMEGLTSTLKQSFVTTAQGKKGMVELDTEMKKLADTANFLRNEVDNITDQLKLFGEQGLQAANALEEIADPTRRIAEGQRLLAAAIRGTRSEMTQLQDTAKVRIAENNLRDMTDTLSRLSPAGQRAAGALGDVSDVTQRNAAAARIMRQEMDGPRGVTGLFSSLGDQVSVAKAEFQALPPLLQGAVAGAITAAAAAAVALTKALAEIGGAAWRAWAEQSRDAQRAQTQLGASLDQLQIKAGRVIEQHLQITDVMYGAAAAVDVLADASTGLSSNYEDVSGPVETIAFGFGKLSATVREHMTYVNPLLNAYERLGGWLEFWGEQERKRVDGLRVFSATTDIVTSTITRMNDELLKTVDASSDATKAMTTGMEGALSRAADLEEQIRRINEAWDDNTALDRGVAVGAITDAGSAALTRKSGGGGAGKKRADDLKAWAEEVKERSKIEREAGAQEEAQVFERMRRTHQIRLQILAEVTGIAGDFNAKLKALQEEERSSVLTEQQEAQMAMVRAYTGDATLGMSDKQREIAELGELTQHYNNVAGAINGAANEAVAFGLSAATGLATALASGESIGGAFLNLLGNVGEFAKATGQTMLLAALGEMALAGGNPALAAVLGGSLLALGIGLSAAHGRVTASSGNKGGSPGASSAGESRLREIADTFRAQGSEDREGRTVNIYVDGDQIQGTIERGVMRGAQRGVFGVPQPAGFLR